jgi:elongator complex protein 3
MLNTNLKSILAEINQGGKLSEKRYHQLVKKYPKDKKGIFTKAEIIAAWRKTYPDKDLPVQVKPVRTISGVVPVTLLTKPYPCPGQCIFCPNDPKMPKSYLSSEPGAQRAAANHFDPYNQVTARLMAYHANGHSTDKAELIVLGGTWSSYPKNYKIWFIKRCFDALNDFQATKTKKTKTAEVSGVADWPELFKAQKKNERSASRCVGLSLETRPDFLNEQELIRFRKLGCTKVQIGIQSLNNKVLDLNKRGHRVEATKKAVALLRQAGFKIQAHWMANLYGSSPDEDIKDFAKLFSNKAYRPDELKIYPTALIETAELMDYYKKGLWKPFSQEELLKVLVAILPMVPEYCRVTRMIRDFSSDDIVAGNKLTNFRENVEKEIAKRGKKIKEIRSREIKKQTVSVDQLSLKVVSFSAGSAEEKFIQFVTKENSIAGFLRLSLPKKEAFIKELSGSALVRELHVYGQALNLGEAAGIKPQHSGLGKKLLVKAQQLAGNAGFKKLSVISAIGTKQYYQKQGFKDGDLYQHLSL